MTAFQPRMPSKQVVSNVVSWGRLGLYLVSPWVTDLRASPKVLAFGFYILKYVMHKRVATYV